MDYKKLSLRMVGLIGLFVFSALLGFTYSIPKTVEESAKNFVKRQIEQEVKIKYQLMAESDAATHALKLATLLGVEEDQLRADLDNDLPKKIASIVAQLCGYDCEKKKELAISLTNSTWDKVKGLQVAQINLTDLVKGEYLKILGNLKLDLRIFLGANAVLFMIVLLASILKPQAIQHLFLPSVLLLVATTTSSIMYIFGQDWFYTIIYNDYMGYAYLAYVGVIFGFLMDVAFNSARLTAEIINAIAEMIGSTLSLAPC